MENSEHLKICALPRKHGNIYLYAFNSAVVLSLLPPAGWKVHDARHSCTRAEVFL